MRLLFIFILFACGQEPHIEKHYEVIEVEVDKPDPDPVPDPDPTAGIGYAKMELHLVTYCQQCHATAGFMSSERALRASGAESKIKSRAMPTSNANTPLPDNIRTEMISFF